MKLAVIGSRSFNEQTVFDTILEDFLRNKSIPTILVSGKAPGVDTLAEKWASRKGVPTRIFEPKYEKFPKRERRWRANKERNTEIAEFCEVLLAFWDMRSTGTKDTLIKALDLNKTVYIYNINSGSIELIRNKEHLQSL
ncbi:MAG: DUF2493 domain-containing protein [Cryomorphaceae bacterium]|jgi:hypothetical protein|nr:DUF2493 domain-containing protein [Cryomorphaceae bacterium]